MSEKVFITSDIANGGDAEPVNLELTHSFRKLSNGNKPSIQFSTQAANSNWQPIEWKYNNVADRDQDYNLIKQKYVQSINEDC